MFFSEDKNGCLVAAYHPYIGKFNRCNKICVWSERKREREDDWEWVLWYWMGIVTGAKFHQESLLHRVCVTCDTKDPTQAKCMDSLLTSSSMPSNNRVLSFEWNIQSTQIVKTEICPLWMCGENVAHKCVSCLDFPIHYRFCCVSFCLVFLLFLFWFVCAQWERLWLSFMECDVNNCSSLFMQYRKYISASHWSEVQAKKNATFHGLSSLSFCVCFACNEYFFCHCLSPTKWV